MGNILLREFMQQGFSLAKLNSLESLDAIRQYCCQYLGEPIGEGSDRVTFEIGDGEVIKIARSDRAIQQNMQEYTNYKNISTKNPQMSNMFPKVFLIDKRGRWMTCERVLKLDKVDCDNIIGMSRWDLLDVIDYIEGRFNYTDSVEINPKFEYLIKHNQWFQNIYNYIRMTYNHITDLSLNNFGIALRNKKPFIVILDSGIDDLMCENKIRFINLTTENVQHEPTDYFGNYSYQEYIYENLNEGLIHMI